MLRDAMLQNRNNNFLLNDLKNYSSHIIAQYKCICTKTTKGTQLIYKRAILQYIHVPSLYWKQLLVLNSTRTHIWCIQILKERNVKVYQAHY